MWRPTRSAELWTSTRVDAMDSGEVLLFRYRSGSNRYRIERQQADDSSGSTTSGSGAGGAKVQAVTAAAARATHRQHQRRRSLAVARRATAAGSHLPEGVTFASGEVTAADDQGDPTQQLPSTIDSSTKSDATWSEPILFYIDGTCSNARLCSRTIAIFPSRSRSAA